MSFHQSHGISIGIFVPLWAGTNLVDDSIISIASYSHTISAWLGYDTAELTFSTTLQHLEDWVNNGLGRRLVTYRDAGTIIWEGFVNQVSATIGGRSISSGELMGITNRDSVTYTRLIDDGTNIINVGAWLTPIAQDLVSQARYGILETVYSAGTCSEAVALQTRDSLLNEYKNPERSQDFSNAGEEVQVTLSLLGYAHLLSRFVYNNPTGTFVTLTTKLTAVLAAFPLAGIFSTDYSMLGTNALLVNGYEDENRYGLDILSELVSIGDGTSNRWVFGVYAGRKFRYQPIPLVRINLEYRLTDQGSFMYYRDTGSRLKAFAIQPGVWVYLADTLTGLGNQSVPLRENKRLQFIEQVTFTAPDQFSLVGSKVYNSSQILAQIGLGVMTT